MSTAPNVIEFPLRDREPAREALEREIVHALATADDLASAMDRVVASIYRRSCANRVEWWTTGDDGAAHLGAAVGIVAGNRHELPLGVAGQIVLHGGRVEAEVASVLATAAPVIRRRLAEERLERTAIDLARRNEALEDFAGLVAHELKNPLHAALVADDASSHIEGALDLIESLLEVARSAPTDRVFASPGASVDQAVDDVGAGLEVTTDLHASLPLPPGPLRVILRNLLSNAVSAGAHHVHVAAVRSSHEWRLLLDDDGVGLEEGERYASGSGLGLSLSRRIAGRFGGDLELVPRASGGTRAILEFTEAA